MIESIVKHISVIIWCFYIINKFNYGHEKKYTLPSIILSAFCICIATCILRFYASGLDIIFLVFSFCLNAVILLRVSFKRALTYAIISVSVSFAVYFLSSLIVSVFAGVFFLININIYDFIFFILADLLHGVIIFLIFKAKRLSKGLIILKNKELTLINLIVCVILLVIYFLSNYSNSSDNLILFLLTVSLLIIVSLGIFILWDKCIKKIYLDYLKLKEIQALRIDLEKKDHYIKQLEIDNANLSSIIHRDNKFIPAMRLSVMKYFSLSQSKCEFENINSELIIAELDKIMRERNFYLADYRSGDLKIQKTNIFSVDSVLEYMSSRAKTNGIIFETSICKNIHNLILTIVSESDLTAVTADLIENAIYAVEDSNRKKITFGISFINGILQVYTDDNGTEFPVEVYNWLGLKRITKRSEKGGTGIGFMSVAGIAEKYQAGIIIHEYPQSENNFTKRIGLVFDRKKEFNIYSYRYELLQNSCGRKDINIFSLEKKHKKNKHHLEKD